MARRLASDGAHVIVHGRNREREMELVAEIAREGKGSARFYAAEALGQLDGTGVMVNALHPATLMPTGMVARMGARPRATIDEGANAVMQLIISTEIEGGQYFRGQQPARAHDQAYDLEARAKLKKLSEELTGVG